ncbi:MAG: hypothetical protein KF773_28200 [Deltaproteobacteria bacterium]|nr:hypothetical protein [Deltaproteobacteria bacterium]
MRAAVALAGLVSLTGACSSHRSAPKPAHGSGGGSAVAVLPDVPFADLDREQRAQLMRDVVVPALKPRFQAHDPAKHAGFGCATCHGASERFEMPNPALPAIDPRDLTAWHARDVEFMERVVVPEMARLLGRAPDGAGCLACHVRK